MEFILSSIAEAPVSASAKKHAYELVIKILKNIIQAAENKDPNLEKYKWIKAQVGSSLRQNVLSVSPLFRELLEALGFSFRVGRPPHVRLGGPQEYVVFQGEVRLDDLAGNVQVLEAVVQSLSEEEQQPEEVQQPQAEERKPQMPQETSPSCSPAPRDAETDVQEGGDEPVACCLRPCSRGSPSASGTGRQSELEELRREQRERYRQRGAGGGGSSRPSTDTPKDAPGDDSQGGWFWQRFGWGGGSNSSSNGSSTSQARSSSSRRPPPNNRMMTLRDLPKPQRRG
ncbi:hypothetical protein Esti_005202 [Eimeria stiedai]